MSFSVIALGLFTHDWQKMDGAEEPGARPHGSSGTEAVLGTRAGDVVRVAQSYVGSAACARVPFDMRWDMTPALVFTVNNCCPIFT